MQLETRKTFEPAAWHRLYHQADPSPSQRLFRRVTQEVFLAAQPLLAKDTLWMDLGCGTGELSRQLADAGTRVIAIDLDPAMLQWSGQHTLSNSSVDLLAATTVSLPCASHSIDGIVAASLTGCLDNLDPFWRELSRVLVPGGYAVLSFTNKQSLLLALSSRWRRTKQVRDTNHPCHGSFQRYLMQDTVDAAADYGMRSLSYRYFNGFADFDKWSLPPVRIARKLEAYSPNLIRQYCCRNYVMTFQNTGKYSRQAN